MYKVVKTVQIPQTNEEGTPKHLLVKRGKNNQMLAIPCFQITKEVIATGLSFAEAKKVRFDNKGSDIVKE